jgi:hypothetical protein
VILDPHPSDLGWGSFSTEKTVKDLYFRGWIDPTRGPQVCYWVDTGDEKPLDPRFEYCNHSPDGFSWGYHGSGPAQLAYAMLHQYHEHNAVSKKFIPELVQSDYQDFKSDVIAKWDIDSVWAYSEREIRLWLMSR